MMQMDTSTINRGELEKLPPLDSLPPGWHLGNPGMGCFLNPPGHPSYFVQPVYTPKGNNPERRGMPNIVLLDRVVEVVGGGRATDEVLEKFWLKLPHDHPRVQAYVLSMYQYYQGGYVDDAGKIRFQFELDKEKREFADHPGFRDDWREKERAAIAAFNEEIDREWERLAVPERSAAARRVQDYYPEHQPRLDLLGKRWEHTPPDWWTVLAKCPRPEECPGEIRNHGSGSGIDWKHPVNKSWCQVCGWRKDADLQQVQ